jgi:hypothetical protein
VKTCASVDEAVLKLDWSVIAKTMYIYGVGKIGLAKYA